MTRDHYVVNQDKTPEAQVSVRIEVPNPQLKCYSFASPPPNEEKEEVVVIDQETNLLLVILLSIVVVTLIAGIAGTVI